MSSWQSGPGHLDDNSRCGRIGATHELCRHPVGIYHFFVRGPTVRSAEGAVGVGAPVVTMVVRTSYLIYLPLIAKNY